MIARAVLTLLLLGLAACSESSTPAASSPTVLEELPATVMAVRDEVQLAAPAPPPAAAVDGDFARCTVHLVTRWEVGSAATYTQRWQGVIWPGGSSGPTWGIGYDGGYQTRLDIARDWASHPGHLQLVETSGVTGSQARARLPEWRAVRTPYDFASVVFVRASLPSYTAAARRALGPGFVSLPSGARCALVSMGYNRGWQTGGDRRREIRTIRDVCLPGAEPRSTCVAAQLRAMKRLWPDTKGLRDRREDEARQAERTAEVDGVVNVLVVPTFPPLQRATPPRWSRTNFIGAAP